MPIKKSPTDYLIPLSVVGGMDLGSGVLGSTYRYSHGQLWHSFAQWFSVFNTIYTDIRMVRHSDVQNVHVEIKRMTSNYYCTQFMMAMC